MRLAISNERLKLASHVRVCESDGQVILLDLRQSRYLGVGALTAKALAEHVEGWPAQAAGADSSYSSTAFDKLAQPLVSQGLLTRGPQKSLHNALLRTTQDRLPEPTIAEPTASLDLDDAASTPTVGIRQIAQFLKCAAVTSWWIRSLSLYSIAAKVTARRERLMTPGSELLETMQKAAVSYEALRPFVFTAQEKCLHDSLAFVGFLASQGAFPRWVIGVKTSPFGAHSWVQFGQTVLNDQHEYVRRFRPILVV